MQAPTIKDSRAVQAAQAVLVDQAAQEAQADRADQVMSASKSNSINIDRHTLECTLQQCQDSPMFQATSCHQACQADRADQVAQADRADQAAQADQEDRADQVSCLVEV